MSDSVTSKSLTNKFESIKKVRVEDFWEGVILVDLEFSTLGEFATSTDFTIMAITTVMSDVSEVGGVVTNVNQEDIERFAVSTLMPPDLLMGDKKNYDPVSGEMTSFSFFLSINVVLIPDAYDKMKAKGYDLIEVDEFTGFQEDFRSDLPEATEEQKEAIASMAASGISAKPMDDSDVF